MVDTPLIEIMAIALLITGVIVLWKRDASHHEAAQFFEYQDVQQINHIIAANLPKEARARYLNKPEKWWFVEWDEEYDYKHAVYLNLNGAGLTDELDVSGLNWLVGLDCQNNQLTSLKLSRLPSLAVLNCRDNQLVSLDLSGLPLLTHLDFSNNRLTSLILPRRRSSLTCLFCSDDAPPVIVAPKRLKLRTFYGQNNPLSIINPPWHSRLTAFVPPKGPKKQKKSQDTQQKIDE